MTDSTQPETVLILNPQSGSEDHVSIVSNWADLRGYPVEITQREHHAIQLARQAAENGADEIVAVGGDGTLNEVVKGIHAAEALDDVVVGVIPAGTGNDFATNIGITGIEHAFDVLESGSRRQLDLGMADDAPFLNSCVAGITAEASNETSPELKSQVGVLAYALSTLRMATKFSGLELRASVMGDSESHTVWEGTAAAVLVGNGRRFSTSGTGQANIEDGLLDVTIIKDAASLDLATDHLWERLMDTEGKNLERLLASSIELHVESEQQTVFSLDGEILELDSVLLTNKPGVLEMYVGEEYDPVPCAQ
jgi:YegS/Rv2252/BmrU family lipid kinase